MAPKTAKDFASPKTVVAVGTEAVDPLSWSSWNALPASIRAQRTLNPIRQIVDPIVANLQSEEQRQDGKEHISLALGDPTASGILPPCPVAADAIQRTLETPQIAAGYVNACGTLEARTAIARAHETTPDHVIVANGCSGALELVLTALLNEQSILLVPQPGFPLYQVICDSHGARVMHYRLIEAQKWEIDLDHIESLLISHGSQIRAVLVNNPSNPTGAVFSLQHLQALVRLCEVHRVPIVADEVYGDLTFGTNVFHPLAQVVDEMGSHVPVITASGIGKQYLLPGWRVGWVVFHDNIFGSLREIEAGVKRLAQVILGASHLAQTAVPALLNQNDHIVQEWKHNVKKTLQHQAHIICSSLADVDALTVLRPDGAMYAMIRLNIDRLDKSIQNDVDFTTRLLEEENVFVLPGSCFSLPNVIRIVFCPPESILREAADRIHNFCMRHAVD